jgi:predicted nucleic acid-binding protein
MAALVIDASLTASWCFPDERTDYTNAVLRGLWACEVRNSVLMGLRRRRITRADAEEFLDSLTDLPIRLSDPLSYDGLFALAVRENLPLASLDGALIRAATQSGIVIFQP